MKRGSALNKNQGHTLEAIELSRLSACVELNANVSMLAQALMLLHLV